MSKTIRSHVSTFFTNHPIIPAAKAMTPKEALTAEVIMSKTGPMKSRDEKLLHALL